MKFIKKSDKRGKGSGNVFSTIEGAFMGLIGIVFSLFMLFVLGGQLLPASGFDVNTTAYNNMEQVINDTQTGALTFTGSLTNIFQLLSLVIIIGALVLVFKKFKESRTSASV